LGPEHFCPPAAHDSALKLRFVFPMPITLPPLTRRDWIKRGSAAAIGTFATQTPALEIPEQVWVLFSDTHIAADETLNARGVCMAENLRRCANQVLKIGQKPFGLIVNGDCAYLEGISEDYVAFLRCIQPLREQSIQIHCTLGNHDHRTNFLNAVIGPPPPNAERIMNVPDKHVATVTSAQVNWLLLDSLDLVNKTPGMLGQPQLTWIERELRNSPDKPTFVVAHHNPMQSQHGRKEKGLLPAGQRRLVRPPGRLSESPRLHLRPHAHLAEVQAREDRPTAHQSAPHRLHLQSREHPTAGSSSASTPTAPNSSSAPSTPPTSSTAKSMSSSLCEPLHTASVRSQASAGRLRCDGKPPFILPVAASTPTIPH
jgi:3',5'-cyclic-AMP phosphodiesterase